MKQQQNTIQRSLVDIGMTFARQTVSGILQLCLVAIVGFTLGADGVGTYSVALLLPAILAQLLSLGIPSSLVYFIASENVSPQTAWSAGRDAILFLAAVGTAIGAVLIMLLSDLLFPGVPREILFTCLGVFPLMLCFNYSLSFLQARQDFRSLNYAILSQSVIAMGLFLIVAATGIADVQTYVALVILSHILALALTLSAVSRHVSLFTSSAGSLSFLRPAIKYGLTAHASNMVTFLNYRLDLALVNALAGTTAAGIYAVAVRIVEQLWVFSTAFVTVVFPRMASMTADEEGRREYTSFMGRSVLWVTFAASLVLALIAKPAIILVFGAEFTASASVVYVLLPGVVVMSMARVLSHDLAARGLVRENFFVSLGALLSSIIISLALIPFFGAHGAALATSLSYLVFAALHIWLQVRYAQQKVVSFVIPVLWLRLRLRHR